ncbi:forkhead box protein I1c-like [Ranitomeya variabilis]|uniref:forkhead box protein I1c-like n=1 Tax=Ranitomeya variabilis TaxID=490064 RepID=UPI004056A57C
MDMFGQHASCSQRGYHYAQDFEDPVVNAGDHFNVHQQNLHHSQRLASEYGVTDDTWANTNSYWKFGGLASNPSYLNGNISGYLPSGYDNNQAQVLTPAGYAMSEEPSLTYLSYNDTIQKVRPPFSYSALIAMALQNAPEKKLRLRQICNYVINKFPFYQKNGDSWQKSIKHTLSINKCFKKVARDDHDPGKGTYWTLDPNCDKRLNDNGCFQKQRRSKGHKPSKNTDNGKFLKCGRLLGSSDGKIKSSPPLDTSTTDFTSSGMGSNEASAWLNEDFSFYKLSSTDDHHNSSLPGEFTFQVNLPQTFALPNQLEEPVLISHQASTCEPMFYNQEAVV